MNHYLIYLLVSLSILSCNHQPTQTDSKTAAVDQLFQRWDTNQTPGAAVGIIQNGLLLYAKGYGKANLEHGIPNTDTTAFNIASNSKQFTAACITLLVLKESLSLTQTLDEFFPDFPSYSKDITIYHLLHHISGLRDFSQITYLSGKRPDDYYNDRDIVKWIQSQRELNFPPGEQYLYSNSGYWLLGQIVEKVTGLPLAEFARQEIFIPLNMLNTQFHHNNATIIKQRASGYSRTRSGGYRHIYSTPEYTGNAGVYTTVKDLIKWNQAFYDRKLLKDDFWNLMMSPGTLNNGEKIPYAHALIFDDYRGLKTIDHGGRAPGYQSNMIRFLDEDFTVILLANTSGIDAKRMCHAISDIFLADKLTNNSIMVNDSNQFVAISTKSLDQFSGSYWSLENSISRSITLIGDTLRYERGRGRTHALLPLNESEFLMCDTPPDMKVVVRFFTDENIRKMAFIENGSEVDTWELYQPVSYSPKELATFIGKYYSTEIETYYELKMESEEQVFLYINGDRTVPLHPVMEDFFSSPIGVFRFSKNKAGQISGFRVSTPRVKNLLFLKS